MNKILIPLPEMDFDPSEASIPWRILKDNNINITFATPSGQPSKADERMVTGKGLGLFKKLLMANKAAIECYTAMIKDTKFINPIKYDDINPNDYSGIIIPGGHSPNTRKYYESRKLQNIIVKFFEENKIVGAICHGVLLVARSIDPKTGQSVIHNYNTTSLLKSQELLSYYLTYFWLKKYFKTYPTTVEEEVKSILVDKNNFKRGNLGLIRDSINNTKIGFSVHDKNYISARWFGDAFHFSSKFLELIKNIQDI